jgi:hypothetical protein
MAGVDVDLALRKHVKKIRVGPFDEGDMHIYLTFQGSTQSRSKVA